MDEKPYYPRAEFKTLVDEIKASGESKELTVRKLLNLFYQERRSKRVIPWIKSNLSKNGIECVPDFENVYIDSTIELRKKPTVGSKKKGGELPEDSPVSPADIIPRLALLPAANRPPVTVRRDADIKQAITLMLMHDFSQLPVMQNERGVDGMVSWRSIVNAQAAGKTCNVVRDCMSKDVEAMPADATLFDAVKRVMACEVVLVRGSAKRIVGLVTIADIAQQFVDLGEPFLILEQIENHVRAFLDQKFTVEQLKEAIDPSDEEREIEAISDLTFGEYIRLVETPENWAALRLGLDRGTFSKRLDEVRRIRNDVMHFHPDGISDADKVTLRETAEFFFALSQFKSGLQPD